MSSALQFAEHPLVNALGWTLLHFVWQGAAHRPDHLFDPPGRPTHPGIDSLSLWRRGAQCDLRRANRLIRLNRSKRAGRADSELVRRQRLLRPPW